METIIDLPSVSRSFFFSFSPVSLKVSTSRFFAQLGLDRLRLVEEDESDQAREDNWSVRLKPMREQRWAG